MEKGNFSKLVELLSPLAESYGEFPVYVNLFSPKDTFEASPTKEMLPLCQVETNSTGQNEVCLMVVGLSQAEQEGAPTPLSFGRLVEQFESMKNSCKESMIVLAQKNMADPNADEESEYGDYIIVHLPISEIKTASDNEMKQFFLLILPFGEEREHIHYGNINDPDAEGVIYRHEQV